MPSIHSTAIVEPGAVLGEGVEVGPFCHVGPEVELGQGCRLIGHVSIAGRTRLGANCIVYPFASLGHPPQDLKYEGEPSQLVIGERCVIREHVTVNTGTQGGGMVTRIGNHCLLMVGVHVAHDCQIGDRVIMANNATLAGHVTVGDGAVIGGLSAVLQFVRIGEGAMIGGMSGVEQDVIPFGLVKGERACLVGLNLVGLKRCAASAEEVGGLRSAFETIFQTEGDTLAERAQSLRGGGALNPRLRRLLDFIQEPSRHGICRPSS